MQNLFWRGTAKNKNPFFALMTARLCSFTANIKCESAIFEIFLRLKYFRHAIYSKIEVSENRNIEMSKIFYFTTKY